MVLKKKKSKSYAAGSRALAQALRRCGARPVRDAVKASEAQLTTGLTHLERGELSGALLWLTGWARDRLRTAITLCVRGEAPATAAWEALVRSHHLCARGVDGLTTPRPDAGHLLTMVALDADAEVALVAGSLARRAQEPVELPAHDRAYAIWLGSEARGLTAPEVGDMGVHGPVAQALGEVSGDELARALADSLDLQIRTQTRENGSLGSHRLLPVQVWAVNAVRRRRGLAPVWPRHPMIEANPLARANECGVGLDDEWKAILARFDRGVLELAQAQALVGRPQFSLTDISSDDPLAVRHVTPAAPPIALRRPSNVARTWERRIEVATRWDGAATGEAKQLGMLRDRARSDGSGSADHSALELKATQSRYFRGEASKEEVFYAVDRLTSLATTPAALLDCIAAERWEAGSRIVLRLPDLLARNHIDQAMAFRVASLAGWLWNRLGRGPAAIVPALDFYAPLVEEWQSPDPAVLQPALELALDVHVEEGGKDPLGRAAFREYELFPVEIWAINGARRAEGLPPVDVEHPMLRDNPFAERAPWAYSPESDPVLGKSAP